MTIEHKKTGGGGGEMPYIARLVALKRHEQPGPGFDTRMSARIHARIAEGAPRLTFAEWLFGIGDGSASRVLRLAGAAAFVGILGAGLHLGGALRGSQPTVAATPAAQDLAPIEQAVAVADTNESFDTYQKPIFVFETASNRSSGVQYGTGPTIPVRFDR